MTGQGPTDPFRDNVRRLRRERCHQNDLSGSHRFDRDLDIDGRRAGIFVKDYIETRASPFTTR